MNIAELQLKFNVDSADERRMSVLHSALAIIEQIKNETQICGCDNRPKGARIAELLRDVKDNLEIIDIVEMEYLGVIESQVA